MEDDDEFGDLYTDVLSVFPPFSSSSSSPHSDLKPQPITEPHPITEPQPQPHPITEPHPITAPQPQSHGVDDHTSGATTRLTESPIFDHQPPVSIPGLHSSPCNIHNPNPNAINPIIINNNDEWEWERERESESESESDDDLQIVLNDDAHHMPPHLSHIVMDENPDGGSGGDDDDGDDIIVADPNVSSIPNSNGQDPSSDWGDPHPPPSDPSAIKPTPTKLAFPPFHHPFHSHFKYVRPGATPPAAGVASPARPQMNMVPRPRPDGRPPSVKPSFWSSNLPSRSLDFTLPSHKTIFDVDIDSFEEKPWKYPGVDVSDYFNFGMNEDNWKEYCKQLEQLRLESTMQSKIRVYESGRAEQEYDPDMPPELAAAAGIHDSLVDNADITKAESGLGDLDQGSLRLRPPLPTGRPIQVETGCGERLPSIDTRPPRLRDSDTVIEIVLQGSLDADKGAIDHSDNDYAKEDDKVDVYGEDHLDLSQVSGDAKVDVIGNRSPVISSHENGTQEDEERDKSPIRTLSGSYHSGSKGNSSTENIASPYEMRLTKGKTDDSLHHDVSSGESSLDHHQEEDSIDSMENKSSNPEIASPNPIKNAQEPSLERNVALEKQTPNEKEPVISADTSMDKHRLQSTEFQERSSHMAPSAAQEIEDGGDFKVCRSSDNSKATESSRDQHKWRESIDDDDEVQNGHSTYIHGVGRHDSQRKERHVDKNYLSSKRKEDYYLYRDWDPYTPNTKSEGIERRKERDYSEVSGQWRDEEVRSRRGRAEEVRKQDSADEFFSRHRGKARSNKDEYLHSRKFLDSGSCRSYHHDKDVGLLRYKEKDDSLKIRPKVVLDDQSKRRKDEHREKEDIIFAHKESSSNRRKRERDDTPSQRKRNDQLRARDNLDDHHSGRFVDEFWVQRERAEQQKERDEWYQSKLPYEENLSRRDRDDGRSPNSSRNVEEKTWIGHSRGKGGEYKGHDKDKRRRTEPLDRMEDDIISVQQKKGIIDGYARGVQISKEGKRSSRSSARNDHLVHPKDKQRNNHKDGVRKDNRESEGTSAPSKKHHGGKDVANEAGDKVVMDEHVHVEGERDKRVHVTGKRKDNISSDDEEQEQEQGWKRGRSKLERWSSHKEREGTSSSLNNKLAASSKLSKNKSGEGGEGGVKKVVEKEESKGGVEGKEGEGQLDTTVEKLKLRSERFKLPLTNEKDVGKTENEEGGGGGLSGSSQVVVVKQERPARKRRWISSS